MIYLYLFGTCFHFIYVFMIIGNKRMIYLSIYLHVNFRTECVTLKNSLCIFYGTLLSGSLLCLITERKLNFNYFNRLKPT